MKILTFWLWAFWYAINKHLWENNKNITFLAYDINKEVSDFIESNRQHPYFFKWYKLPLNIKIINSIDDCLENIDLLIIAIPTQFISLTFDKIKLKLKKWVTILNLSKWIDIKTNKTISQLLEEKLFWFDYNYWILSWWMIAQELIEQKHLWADLWIKNKEIWIKIKTLFQSKVLDIKLQDNYLNIELYSSFKNIIAIYIWYYEWKWLSMSSIWYYLVNIFNEIKKIIKLYSWDENIDFWYYSLWWDLIATCFWDSRNRYFWKLLWEWKKVNQALEILKNQNKYSEWYETLKAVFDLIKDKDWFDNIKFLYNLIK